VREEPLELPVAGGALRGHRAGTGRPALLLHGGAAAGAGAVAAEGAACDRQLEWLFAHRATLDTLLPHFGT